MSSNTLPIPYTVRISPRAKHVRLSIGANKGLEVIVPRGFDHHQIPGILMAQKDWITKNIARSKQPQPEIPSHVLPEVICLKAIDENWNVLYAETHGTSYRITPTGKHELCLSGPDRHVRTMASLLNKWLINHGKRHLPGRLERLRQAHDFPTISRIQVRNQKSRWASCSAKGTVSLNAKLLFIDPELVDYILIHELCHLIHLDHSPKFWNTVAKHMADFRTHENLLKQAWQEIPAWTGV